MSSGESEPVKWGWATRKVPLEFLERVGPNGAGKTTLMSLLPRLIEPESGMVVIDGQDVRDLTLESLRRAVGVVRQDAFLFAGTIEENIRRGNPTATHKQILQAVKTANLDEVLQRLPDGLNTQVGERGLKLSGGERQRIAIARAADGPRDPDSGRGDVGCGPGFGHGNREGPGTPDERPHRFCHRASPGNDPTRGEDRRHE